LGFVRVLAQVREYGYSVAEAKTLLLNLKKSRSLQFSFISDCNDISSLPIWAKTPKQTTDGYLVELAQSQGAMLATLDHRIPDSCHIP
jgi:predicted nucleic acid-binding protein